jgi:hypothetical protein
MTGRCRHRLAPSWRRVSSAQLLRHARIVTDPEKLAYLIAEVERRRTNSKANEDVASRGEGVVTERTVWRRDAPGDKI